MERWRVQIEVEHQETHTRVNAVCLVVNHARGVASMHLSLPSSLFYLSQQTADMVDAPLEMTPPVPWVRPPPNTWFHRSPFLFVETLKGQTPAHTHAPLVNLFVCAPAFTGLRGRKGHFPRSLALPATTVNVINTRLPARRGKAGGGLFLPDPVSNTMERHMLLWVGQERFFTLVYAKSVCTKCAAAVDARWSLHCSGRDRHGGVELGIAPCNRK